MRACPNHVYPVKHKLRNCGMMNNFMISGSLTRDMELEEHQDRRDVMPFPEEDAVMTVYEGGGAPHVQPMSRDPNSLWLRTRGHKGVKAQVFQYIYLYDMCVCILQLVQ
jgi:hypothetical protein